MPLHNADIAAIFAEIADLLEIQGANPFRVRAYRNAARSVESGLQVDLRVVPEESFGAALHYFTGSKAHNIAVQRLGQQRGLKINEYGVFSGDKRIAGETEESVFGAVGLPWIPPELREDQGEIEAAQAGRLPKLIELANLRFGIGQARRGWLEKGDVLNTRTLAQLRPLLERTV